MIIRATSEYLLHRYQGWNREMHSPRELYDRLEPRLMEYQFYHALLAIGNIIIAFMERNGRNEAKLRLSDHVSIEVSKSTKLDEASLVNCMIEQVKDLSFESATRLLREVMQEIRKDVQVRDAFPGLQFLGGCSTSNTLRVRHLPPM